MKILVLGGSQFVGRAIVDHFVANGHAVTVLNRGTRPLEDVEQIIGDRDEVIGMKRALANRSFDVVVDCSAMNAQHVESAVAAIGSRVDRWVHISSGTVYASGALLPIDETAPTGGHVLWAEYGVEKSEADRWLLRSSVSEKVTILRPPYVFGPRNNLERESFVWRRLRDDRPVFVPGSGQTVVQFLHADDLAIAVEATISTHDAAGHTFNVADPSGMTFDGWIEMLARIAGVSPKIVHVPDGTLGYRPRDYFPFRDITALFDASALHRVTGWSTQLALVDRFSQTYEALCVNGFREDDVKVGDIERKLAARLARSRG
jgi:nucleoside-diphosphate-sugar epimerase